MTERERGNSRECAYVREARPGARYATMHRRLLPLILVAIGLASLPGCYYDSEEELYPNTFCDTSAVTWSGTIEPLVQSSCAIPGCHVPGGQSPSLTSYTEVKAIADDGKLLGVVVTGSPYFMPPSGKLRACDQISVQSWIAAGAPQN